MLEQTIRAKGDTLLATLLDDPQHDAMPEICVEGNKQLGGMGGFKAQGLRGFSWIFDDGLVYMFRV